MNPYRPAPGSDPPALVGRDAEITFGDEAIALTRDGGAARPIVLTGLRGMGKTALLRRFERKIRSERGLVLSAEADVKGDFTETMRGALAKARREVAPISTALRKAIDATVTALPEASFELPEHLGSVTVKTRRAKEHERLNTALEELNVLLRKHERWLAIAIDEIQQADATTLGSLISSVHASAGTDEPILFLGAGLRSARNHLKLVRTYAERWRYLELGLLGLTDTMDAIGAPARENGEPFTPDALEALATASLGYPFFVQEFASSAWSRRDTNRKRITLEDVRKTIPLVKQSLEREFYGDPLRRLSARELDYVIAMARLGDGEKTSGAIAASLGSIAAATSSTRQQLIRKDIIYSPERGVLEFRVPLMAAYVRVHAAEIHHSK